MRGRRHGTRSRITGLAAPLLALPLLAACSGGSQSLPPLTAPPATAGRPAPSPSTPPAAPGATASTCGDPVASFAPDQPLPAPGQMPITTYMKQIQDRGRLRVGVSGDTLLFGARNPISGRIEGFDIDMLHAVAQAIFGDPDRIEFTVITYAQRLPSLQNGSVDLVAHTMTINCRRWQQISFSAEYFHAGQKVLVRRDSPAKA